MAFKAYECLPLRACVGAPQCWHTSWFAGWIPSIHKALASIPAKRNQRAEEAQRRRRRARERTGGPRRQELSLPRAQLARVKLWSEDLGNCVVDAFEEIDVSGELALVRRPGLMSAIETGHGRERKP